MAVLRPRPRLWRCLPVVVAGLVFLSREARCFVGAGRSKLRPRARAEGLPPITAREAKKASGSHGDLNLMVFDARRDLAWLAPQMGSIVVTSMVLLGVFSAGGSSGEPSGEVSREWNTRVQVNVAKERGTETDGTTWYRTVTTSVRETRTGAPLEELSRQVGALESSRDQAELSERLLDELQASDSAARASRLQSMLWQTWYYHEDSAARALLQDGSDLLQAGEYQEAKKCFLHAAILEPTWGETWNRLATVNYLMGFYDESLAEIDKTLELVPRHFGALSGRGLVMLKLERYREALEAFQDAQEVCPASENAAANVAYAERLLPAPEASAPARLSSMTWGSAEKKAPSAQPASRWSESLL